MKVKFHVIAEAEQVLKPGSHLTWVPISNAKVDSDNGITLLERLGDLERYVDLEIAYILNFVVDKGHLVMADWTLCDYEGNEIFIDELKLQEQEEIIAALEAETERHAIDFKSELKNLRLKKQSLAPEHLKDSYPTFAVNVVS